MPVLDRNRPYGVCYGAPNGAKFIQDGVEYDGSGNPIGANAPVTFSAPDPAPAPVAAPIESPLDPEAPLNVSFGDEPARPLRSAFIDNSKRQKRARKNG